MRNLRWALTGGVLACGLPVACADPCIDDGLGQAGEGNCPQASASATEGSTESSSISESITDTMGTATMGSNTDAMTGSQTGVDSTTDTVDGTATDTGTATGTATETVGETGGTLWCVDSDGDGFGDPDMCTQSDEQPPGTVDNDDDCDDDNPNTFPGAAPSDDPLACMQDEDGDDWGDDDPPAGVDAGTDCVDDDATVYPGAADNEMPPDLCAQDADGDGWGDADPPMGADPGTDCDDGNPNTFPGAAPNDDPLACMQDEDGDDWGDDAPPAGVDAGTDCDDDDDNAFPGAAENEDPPGSCMVDADGDGWGDANPGGGGGGGGPVGGSDCYDGNLDLNPDTLQLTAFMPFNGAPMVQRTLQTVDPTNAALGPFITLEDPMGANPNVNLVTATMDESGAIFANDLNADQVFGVDYAGTCGMGTGVVAGVGAMPMPYTAPGVDTVCGLEFDGAGTLYAIDNGNNLITFDPTSGQITGQTPIALGMGVLDISSCGMAYDCAQDRLLVANGIDWSIYSVDTTSGEATLLRDLDPFFGPAQWTPVGLAWEPISRTVYLSTGNLLYNVDIDDPVAPPTLVGPFVPSVSNLQYLPVCSP
jgi:hypothetical protein